MCAARSGYSDVDVCCCGVHARIRFGLENADHKTLEKYKASRHFEDSDRGVGQVCKCSFVCRVL